MSKIDFNFNEEQQEKFTLIYNETCKLYPHLVSTTIDKERIKILIAHSVINNDASIGDFKNNKIEVKEEEETEI